MTTPVNRGTSIEQIVDFICYPCTHVLATHIDEVLVTIKGGRPSPYPTEVRLGLLFASALYKGDETAANELQRDNWATLAALVHQRRPDLSLPDTGPTRDVLRKFRGRLANHPALVVKLQALKRHNGVGLALAMGLFPKDPARDGDTSVGSCLVADQTTYRAPAGRLNDPVDSVTGDPAVLSTRRSKLSGATRKDGTNRKKYGLTSVNLVAYSGYPGESFVIDARLMPTDAQEEDNPALLNHRSEGKYWIEILELLADAGLDLQDVAAIIHDGALRGERVETIHKRFGIPVISPTKSSGAKVLIGMYETTDDHGEPCCTQYLIAHRGELFYRALDKRDVAIEVAATHTGVDITGVPGNYEVSGLWRVPCMKVPEQAHIIRVTATGEGSTSFEGGRTTRVQKIEHLRPAPFSSDFAEKGLQLEPQHRRVKQLSSSKGRAM